MIESCSSWLPEASGERGRLHPTGSQTSTLRIEMICPVLVNLLPVVTACGQKGEALSAHAKHGPLD